MADDGRFAHAALGADDAARDELLVPLGLARFDPSFDPAGMVPPSGKVARTPELQLMAAVLGEALDDYRRCLGDGRPRQQRLLLETREWFESPDRAWPYSFEPIAAALDLDAGAVRAHLAGWAETARSGTSGTGTPRAHLRRMAGSRAHQVVLRRPVHGAHEQHVA